MSSNKRPARGQRFVDWKALYEAEKCAHEKLAEDYDFMSKQLKAANEKLIDEKLHRFDISLGSMRVLAKTLCAALQTPDNDENNKNVKFLSFQV